MASQDISYFARTNHRNLRLPFGIKQADRLFHMYAIGQTGVGKSTLLETLAWQDFETKRGLAFVDPHGDNLFRPLTPFDILIEDLVEDIVIR